MKDTKILIAANSANPQGMTITLESTSIFLGIIVSMSMIVGVAIKAVSKFNSIANEIRDLREDLNKTATISDTVREIHKDVLLLDKRFDVHLQDYENRKDTVQMILGQLNEKIDHKTQRLEREIEDIETYLQKEQSFKT
ncbi:hypothetical protein [Nostoc sp. FACHB-280]|uniref:hypothetical protein n=1 Tax=Nostoc sp. FACHB-280 TaxID=2692839 RepID=UPI00168C0A16|nr:hypothetical protein [Nostoc sp. FACHB-280]MBD2495012.1 hypothetical protein [Nostoc sp. FACHB-280]